MRKINFKIIASILLFTSGILFFSLAVQKYQVLTSSKASLNLPQCEIPEGSSNPTNAPCASCSVSNETVVDADGNVTVRFSCQIACNNSGNPLDTNGCSDNLLPYSISETSWYWCKKAGDHACTSQNELTGDLITSAETNGFKSGGPWILSRQGNTDLNAGFKVTGYQGCGRIQIDVETNQKYSYVINSQKDCDNTVTAQDVTFEDSPTPTFGFGFPDQPLTNTPIVQQPSIPTNTPTSTRTPTPTRTPTMTPTRAVSPSVSPSTTPSGTIAPSTSITPSITITGSITPSISVSPSISPTSTPTPTATPTDTPTPTFTPSPTPISNITVNGQSPGGTPWYMMLIPAGIVALGLLL